MGGRVGGRWSVGILYWMDYRFHHHVEVAGVGGEDVAIITLLAAVWKDTQGQVTGWH